MISEIDKFVQIVNSDENISYETDCILNANGRSTNAVPEDRFRQADMTSSERMIRRRRRLF